MRVASLLNFCVPAWPVLPVLPALPMLGWPALRRVAKCAMGTSLLAMGSLTAWAADTTTGDTSTTSHEIQFCSGQAAPYTNCAASDLRKKADALATPVAIFEYLHNNYDYTLYHGARSGSINTFGGGRGNDVDLAATLISMLRSQGYPARYAVGTVTVPSSQVANWLQLNDTNLAYYLLRDMGIQSVSFYNSSNIRLEHVWVEVLVPYNNYRGVGNSGVNCVSTPSACNWVPLDPSFKQYVKRPSGLDPYSALSFNYDAYYAAIKNNDAARRDKSPLEIYRNQVLAWLQTNAPGKTLEDIADFTGIKAEQPGLLPASLPYALAGSASTVRRYNSVADHDVAVSAGTESVKWGKTVTAQVQLGGSVVGSASVSLVDAATQRLTLSFAPLGSGYSGGFSLNGVSQGSVINPNGAATLNGQAMALGTAFKILVSMDGAPAPDAGTTAQNISATYDGTIGGYYLVATGGETSNWGQVHSAAAQLLATNAQTPIVYNPADPGIDTTQNGKAVHLACDATSGLNCVPYVDANHSGAWDASDPKLLDNNAALEPLTGGLLQVAAQQYFTKSREGLAQLDGLNRIRTPIVGFLGVVSSTHSAQYLDSTAFSIEPGGLLIDMKGITFAGSWRIDQPSTRSDSQHELSGHMMSSLEHETWQELTGFDAISTTRGIQIELANNGALTNFYRNASGDTFSTGYAAFGFSTSPPAGFTRKTYTLFGQNYLAWTNPNTSAAFDAIYANSQAIPIGDNRLSAYSYKISDGFDAFYSSYYNQIQQINAWQAAVGQPKTNIIFTSTSSVYNTQDVISLTGTPSGWTVNPVRQDASNYQYRVSETTSHPDATYSVPVTVYLGPTNNTAVFTFDMQVWAPSSSAYIRLDKATVGNTKLVATSWSITGTKVTVGIQPNGAIADGTYTTDIRLTYNYPGYPGTNNSSYTVTGANVQTVAGRVTSGSSPLTFNVAISNKYQMSCQGSTYTALPSALMTYLQGCFNSAKANSVNAINFFSPTATLLYRASPAASDARLATSIAAMRDNLYQTDTSVNWYAYRSPTKQSTGSSFQFEVDYFNKMNSADNSISESSYTIRNTQFTAGGGYVTATIPLLPEFSIDLGAFNGSITPVSISPVFNNASMTSLDTVASVNNDWLKAPLTSDPVSTVTGNNVHDETDFTIKGRAGLNYAFTRTYNSAPSSTLVNNAGLGYGWTHSYAMQLKSKDYGACPNCTAAQAPENADNKTSAITYTDERGGDHNYLVSATGVVSSPSGEFESLVVNSPATGQHTLTFRNGTKYIFESVDATGALVTDSARNLLTVPNIRARLKRIADPWGNQLNFSYTGTRLTGVTDNLGLTGRTGLVLAYDASGSLSTVKDWSGRTWTYVVNAAGNLQSYTAAQAPASGATRTYSYATGASNPHNLLTVAKPLQRNGKTVNTTFSYYQNGRTFNYQDALGNVETLDYDLFRKSTRVTDPLGGIREYQYDTAGRLTQLTEPDGAILQFQNTATDGMRYTKADGLGYMTQYSYRGDKTFNTASDTFGNVTREQDALNNKVDTTYGPYDQVASVKDKRGNTVTTSFHASTDATCKLTGKPDTVSIASLTVNATVSPGTVKTNVPLVSYCWNSDGTLKSQTDYLDANNSAHTRVSIYTYTDATHLNVDHVTTVGWDDVSNGGSGNTTTTKYYTYEANNLGRVKTETLKRRNTPTDATLINLTATYTYDNNDRVTQVQDAVGDVVVNSFDDNGQLKQVTHKYIKPDSSFDTRNIVTRTFDAADRVATETDTLGGVTTYQYDAAGNVVAVKDSENHTTKFEYDAMNRRTAVIDANGNRTATAYNLRGEVISVTNAMGETTSVQYDALGRKTQVTDPHGYITKFTSYDANGNLLCVVDANAQAGLQSKNSDGCTESRQYDELNRVTLIRDALNGTTATTYDLLSHPLTQIDAEGRQYAWSYDGLGRLATETDFTGKSTSYASDEAGNVWQKTNRLAEVTQITYDKLNRPTNVKYLKDNSTETTSYDPAGTVRSVANASTAANTTYTFAYDNLKRLLSKSDSRGKALSFTYDKTGNILTKTTYQGSTTSYTYDSANRLVNASNPDYLSVNYQYDAAGRLLSRVMSSGARSIYAYDNGGWLNSLTHYDAAGATVGSTTYSRDRLGHITTLTNSGSATNYTLDALYRLTTVDAPGTANDEAFSYDHIGNRITATRGGSSIGATGSTTRYYNYYPATVTATPVGLNAAYTPTNNNRLKEIRIGSATGTLDASLAFDNEGRLTTQTGTGAKTMAWDAKNRVASVTTGSTTESYAYDPMDHRIKRAGGAVGNLDYFLEGDHLESVYSGGQLQEKYFRGSTIDELVAGYTYQSGTLTPFMFQHDQVMSVSATTTPNGGTQATQTFWAFGETQSTTGTTVTRQQYTGRENDGNGCYQYRARTYCPAIGQFISEDPKKFAAGINFYAYCNNSPIGCNDPTGLDARFANDKSQKALESVTDRTLLSMEQTATGRQVLGIVLDKAYDLQFRVTTGDTGFTPTGSKAGIIDINPANPVFLLGKFDDTGEYAIIQASLERIMGHEIAHATGSRDDGPASMNNVVNFENPMFSPIDGFTRMIYNKPKGPDGNPATQEYRNLNPAATQSVIQYWYSQPPTLNSTRMESGESSVNEVMMPYPNKPNSYQIQSVYSK